MEQKKLSSVEFLAERYEYVSWMLKRDEIGLTTAEEWKVKYLEQAKEMHKQEVINALRDGYSFLGDSWDNEHYLERQHRS
jgi:hypothetical protein